MDEMDPKSPYSWDNFPIGNTKAYANRFRHAVLTSFRNFVRKYDLDWECSIRTDPEKWKANVRCNMVWLTRIEPKQKQQRKDGVQTGDVRADAVYATLIKLKTGFEFKLPMLNRKPPIFLDIKEIPIQDRIDAYDGFHDRVRICRNGWESFSTGDSSIILSRSTDVIIQLRNMCLKRGFDWRWQIRRVQNPIDANYRGPCCLVTRIR